MKKMAYALIVSTALMSVPAMANDMHQHNTHGRYNYQIGSQNDRNEVVVLDRQHVKYIQSSLLQAGYNPGPVDGVLGPRTRAALKSFQKANYLKGEGAITEATLKALDAPEAPKKTRMLQHNNTKRSYNN